MLRAAIKHGITKALSTRAGFEVWDFEIREEQPSPERVTIDIRYRYQPGLGFKAAITAKSEDGKVPTYEITAEAVPGEVGDKENLLLAGRHELCTAIERWTSRIEEELSARPSNRVLAAQEKAISYLEKHLLDIPEQRLTRERIQEYRRRLDRLEAAVIELRAPRDGANGARADAVKQEFAVLHTRLEVLGERSFLHAVLVRLVMYFWDDENLRIIEAGSRAAQDFLRDQDRPLSARSEAPAAARATPQLEPAPRIPKQEPAIVRTATPAPEPAKREQERRVSVPRPDGATLPRMRTTQEPERAAKREPQPVSRSAAPAPKEPPAPRVPAKPEAEKASEPASRPAPERQRATYKPLRPGRG
jgi:pyruvate/2-oxoglutarate dehydrogenase complex dihydrolipoamide acyltransferase (E2) component